jgi:hypothetical protein
MGLSRPEINFYSISQIHHIDKRSTAKKPAWAITMVADIKENSPAI